MTEHEKILEQPGMTRRACLSQGLACLASGGFSQAFAQSVDPVSVGFLSHYAPFSFRDRDGVLKGFDVDVTQLLCTILGVQWVQVSSDMPSLTKKLRAGEIAWIGNQLLATPENRREFDFVRPAYAHIQLTSVQHEDDNRDFLSLDDLVGKKLGVLAQTGVENQARGALGKSVQAYTHIEEALKDLANQRLDVVIEENLIAEYHIERLALPVKVTAPFASPMPVGLPVRKGQSAVQAKLSDAVKTMLNEGAFKRISHKWFGYDVSRSRVGHAMSR
jgi:ABC-type amino acid transport substrate-binding protein